MSYLADTMRPMTICEAAAFAAAEYAWNEDMVPPCDEVATVEVGSYELCRGCADAHEVLSSFGELNERIKRVKAKR